MEIDDELKTHLSLDLLNCSIMIVDDRVENLKLLSAHLKKFNFQIYIAKSGEEALSILAEVTPDLILLDIMMPGIDGYEVCKRLKKSETLREIPVIFLTAMNETINEVKGFKLGAVDYITKPINLDVVMMRLITHLTIRSQKKRLQELLATKDRFFSIIAHDLRGPMGGIREFSKMMLRNLDCQDPDGVKRRIELLVNTSENLYNLLENLLDWARLEKGNIPFEPEIFLLSPIILEVYDLFKMQTGQKRINLEYDCPLDLSVFADKNMVLTIIRNLISNAIKFTQEGGRVAILVKELKSSFVEVVVKDSGMGIHEKIKMGLFKIEKKVSMNGTNGETGTGLGLILCKNMVDKNKGSIWVESELGKGSQFHFTLPSEKK
ncbi:MAG: hybrid sensor histidine kinase/response regulator [Leptospiraceae bacterium]|nr:hybrid sensor histidine kinase/response regulator [Leptospiraceae bacterium]